MIAAMYTDGKKVTASMFVPILIEYAKMGDIQSILAILEALKGIF